MNENNAEAGRPTQDRDASSSPAKINRPGFAARVAGLVPSVLVFAAIGGIAFWGHRTGWRAPRLADLRGMAAVAEKEDWCVEHNVPDSRCIKCHPELVGADAKDWCPEHGLPESKCTICHPDLLVGGIAGDWCPEHGVPETSCTICHPEIAVKGVPPASSVGAKVFLATEDAGAVAATTQHSHATARTAKDAKACQTHAVRVQFASAQDVRRAGVSLGSVVERPMSTTLAANGEVQYDRNRLAQISSPVAGKAWRVEKSIGQKVRRGDVIALIDAADVGKAKAEYLAAIAEAGLRGKTLKRLQVSATEGFRTGAELQESEAALAAANIRIYNARQSLVNLGLPTDAATEASQPTQQSMQFAGLPESVASKLDIKSTTANLLPLLAPFDGTIIERNIVAGEAVEPSKPLFVIVDTTVLWITSDLPQADARRVAIGQPMTFRAEGDTDEAVSGELTWISTSVDDQTRTVKVRADIANPEGRILANTFGRTHITIRQSARAVVVPTEAIQWEGCCNIAFVRLTDDIFQPRKVKLGSAANGFTEITVGLLPGEVVATAGSQVLKAELLKSSLGAGCADDGE